jgi:hypothetical protein
MVKHVEPVILHATSPNWGILNLRMATVCNTLLKREQGETSFVRGSFPGRSQPGFPIW